MFTVGEKLWLMVRTLLLGSIASFVSFHSTGPVAAACATTCGGAVIEPNGTCNKAPSCTSAAKGESGQGCSISGCSCSWNGSNCTGGS